MDSDSERRLRGLLSQKRMTNQILRERRKSPDPAPHRFKAPDPENEGTETAPTGHMNNAPETVAADD